MQLTTGDVTRWRQRQSNTHQSAAGSVASVYSLDYSEPFSAFALEFTFSADWFWVLFSSVTAMKVNINLTPKSNYSQAVIFNSSRAEEGKAQAIPKRTGSVEEGEIQHPNSCQPLSSLR